MKPAIAVLGGDLRQVYLSRLLEADGRHVMTWGLEKGGAPCAVPLHQALEARVLVLPLPVWRDGALNLPLTDTRLETEDLWPRLRTDQLLLGGMTGELPPRLREDFGLTLLDYYDREELQAANAVPTAEGAIALALELTDRTLCGSRCLVMGFGRIGKVLSDRLRALGAEVAVSARKYADLAWVRAMGCAPCRTDALSGALGDYDLIFNTVPALVLDQRLLAETREDCVILDLASAPGGVDFDAAARLGRRAQAAPGLPGKTAPRSAAAAVRESIYHILEERGEYM